MKKLYEFSKVLEQKGFGNRNSLYVGIRTLLVFLPSFTASLLLNEIIPVPWMEPILFIIILCGWSTMIFGF